jgi:peptidoglycan/LPS O-acetylase OafA/YrhL
LSYFAAGIFVFYYLDWIKKHLSKLLAPAMLVFVLEYVNDLEVFKPIALAILITYLAFGLSFLNNFGKYGDVSYGIYILHFPLIQLLVSLGLFKQYNVFLLLFSIVFVVIGLGFASWHLVEKPFLKRKRAPEIA